jgi:hypothetical protein
MGKKIGAIHLTLYVMPDLRDKFKLACVANKTNMTTVLEEFMEKYIEEYENKNDKKN